MTLSISSSARVSQHTAGVALIEVLLAVSLFGMAALGLLRALTSLTLVANEALMEQRMTAVLQSTLTQYHRQPKIEETDRPIITEPDEMGIWTETIITEMNEANGLLLETDESERGTRQPLRQMFCITVIARWQIGEHGGEAVAETYRYAPLFTPQSGQFSQ